MPRSRLPTAVLALLAHLAAARTASAKPGRREVRMYWSKREPKLNLANVPATPVTEYMTGVILCCKALRSQV